MSHGTHTLLPSWDKKWGSEGMTRVLMLGFPFCSHGASLEETQEHNWRKSSSRVAAAGRICPSQQQH
jgi:hypothetical protein